MFKEIYSTFTKGPPPWTFLFVCLLSTFNFCFPESTAVLVYDRTLIIQGQIWRLWTGNIVHFGAHHFLIDTGLFLILGFLLERQYVRITRIALFLMPLAVTGAVFIFDPLMHRYGGLSGLNVGFLVFLACLGWQKSWTDWFWPAVLGLHILELVLEATNTHKIVEFNEPGIRVATIAHVGGIAFGLLLWVLRFLYLRSKAGQATP